MNDSLIISTVPESVLKDIQNMKAKKMAKIFPEEMITVIANNPKYSENVRKKAKIALRRAKNKKTKDQLEKKQKTHRTPRTKPIKLKRKKIEPIFIRARGMSTNNISYTPPRLEKPATWTYKKAKARVEAFKKERAKKLKIAQNPPENQHMKKDGTYTPNNPKPKGTSRITITLPDGSRLEVQVRKGKDTFSKIGKSVRGVPAKTLLSREFWKTLKSIKAA